MAIGNIDSVSSMLARMTPQQRQQFAMMHHDDPFMVSLAKFVNDVEQEKAQALRGQQAMGQPMMPPVVQQEIAQMAPPQAQPMLPEEVGIGALPAPNMERMAGGGITGEDDVEGYAKGGLDQYADLIREEARRQGMDPDLAIRLFTAESGGDPTAVSPKGAVGLGQLLPAAAKEMGLDPKERTDPAKNIRASIGYFMKQQQKYGSPQLAAAAYNWGPGNLDKHLAKNEGKLNTFGLPKETADYLTKLVPVKEARAEATPADREALIAQIPGQTAAGRTPTPEARTTRTPLQAALGAGETGLSLLSGVAALPAGAATSLGQYFVSGKAEPIEKNIGKYVYSPRTEAGREYVGDVAQMAEDLKIPAYIPAIGPVSTTARTAAAAKAAEERAAQAAAAAKQAALPRIPYTLTSDTRNAGQAAQGARALAQQKDEIEAAARASAAAQQEAAAARVGAERVAEEAKYAAGAGQRANIPPAASILAATAEGAPPPEPSAAEPDTSYDRLEKNRLVKQGLAALDVENVPKQDIIDAAKKTEPENKGKGWDAEDWLMLGLGLMANKSPYFLQALGEAGMGVVKGKKEARKEEREDIYRKALAREATAKAAALESGSGDIAKATAYADKEYDNWLNLIKSNPMLAMNVTQEQAEAKRQQILRDAFAMYKIQLPAGMAAANAGEFKFLGVRPS